MRREDYIFTIGYDGETAIVDKKAKKRYGKMSTQQLVGQGLFREALKSVLFEKDNRGIEAVIAAYNQAENASFATAEELMRLFGVDSVRSDISKIKAL